MQLSQTLRMLKHRMATMVALLACVGALGVATVARAQTVAPRLGHRRSPATT